MEEEKRENNASIQASCFLGGAMPVGALMPDRLGSMAHNFGFWRLGESQHPSLSALFLGNVPTRVEAFPGYSFANATLPKAVWIGYPYLRSVK